jgi:glycosyltransferase involved in cell wall biosynthesis
MKVIIGITSKNRVQVLPKAIESALAQTYPNKTIVVFDDASTDGTHLLQSKYPQINWIISKEPKGLMYARNLFLDFEQADFFCSLDDDAWFLSDTAISEAIEYMKENNQIAALAFDILSPDDTEKRSPIKASFSETNIYIGCGHMLNINKAKEAGGYLKSPGFYGSEEKDLCIRLINRNYSIIKANGLYVWHDKTTIARDLAKQHRSGVCNDLVFTYRRVPLVLFVPIIIYKFISHFRFSIFYRQAPLAKPCLNGFKDFIHFLWTGNKQRQAVSLRAYKKFISF